MALDDAELKIVLRATAADLLTEMQRARESVERSTSSMRQNFRETEAVVERTTSQIGQRITVGFSGIQGQLRAFGPIAQVGLAILAVERAMERVVRRTQEWAEESDHLQDALAGTAEETATWAVAAREANFPVEQLDTLIRGLGLHLTQNEAQFKQLGITVRNSATGDFLPLSEILSSTLQKILEYKAGTDQLLVAQRLFGRGATPETIDGLRKTAENMAHARDVARDFGLVLGDDGVIKAEAFARSQADLGLALLAVENILGEALRPEIEAVIQKVTELAKSGELQQWAKDLAEGVSGLGEDIVAVGEFLADHATAIKAAAAAWALYRASLITAGEWTAVIGFLTKIKEAQLASTAANVGLGIAQAAYLQSTIAARAGASAFGIGLAGVTSQALLLEGGMVAATTKVGFLRTAIGLLITSLGPAGIVAVMIAGGAALLTYTNSWDVLTEAVRRFINSFNELLGLGSARPDRKADPTGWKQHLEDVKREIQDLEAAAKGSGGESQQTAQFRDRLLRLRAERAEIEQELSRPAVPRVTDATEPVDRSKTGKNAPPTPEQAAAAEKALYDKLKAQRDQDLQQVQHDAEARLDIFRKYAADVAAIAGVTPNQLAEARLALEEAERKSQEQRTQIEIIGLKARADARKKDLEEQEKSISTKLELGTVSVADATVQLRAIADERYKIDLELLEKQRLLYAKQPKERAQVDADIATAHDTWARDYAEIDRKTAKATLDEWKATAKDIAGFFGTLGSAVRDYLTTLITGTESDLSGLRQELRSASADVDYFRAINDRASDEAINAKQREIDAQNQLNAAIGQQSVETKALQIAQRDLLQGTLNLIEDLIARFAQIQAIKLLGGTPTTKEGSLTEQLASSLFGKLGLGADEKAPEVPAPKPPDTQPLIDAAKQTELKLTQVGAQGQAQRAVQTAASQANIVSTTTQATAEQVATTVGGETTKAGAVVAGEATQVAAVETGVATKNATEEAGALRTIAVKIGEASAKIFASFQDLPLGAGIAIGLAAVAAVAGIMKGFGVFEQGGIVPETGPIIAHKGERVLNVGETEALEKKGAAGTPIEQTGTPPVPSTAGGAVPDEKKKTDDEAGPKKAHTEALGAVASAAGAIAKNVGVGAGGGGGGQGVQKVSLVSAPAHVQTTVSSGKVSISEPVGVQSGGDPLAVQNQGVQSVVVVNTPLRVTFAILSFSSYFETPNFLGFLPTTGFAINTGYAFKEGGYVPSTGIHHLDEGEWVLKKEEVDALGSKSGVGGNKVLSALVQKLTGRSPEGVSVEPDLGGPAGGSISIGGPKLGGFGQRGPSVTAGATTVVEPGEQAPDVHVHYSTLGMATEEQVFERNSRVLGKIIAKEWADRPGRRSRP